jgi:hypothetical protein
VALIYLKIGKTGFLITAVLFTGFVGLPILYAEKDGFLKSRWIHDISAYEYWSDPDRSFASNAKRAKRSGTPSASAGRTEFHSTVSWSFRLPGVSRAGKTSSALIWRSFDSEAPFI